MKAYTSTSKKIFPYLDISINEWYGEIINDIFLYDEYIYPNWNDSKFEELLLNHRYVNQEGEIYKIIGRESLGAWRKYLPFIKKYKLVFERTDEKMTLNEVRDFMIKHIEEDLPNDDYNERWIKALKNSKSIAELFIANGD